MSSEKLLVVLRHAKSSWEETDKTDFDRALKGKGIEDIQLLASKLKKKLGTIDVIYSSPANRAIHTAIRFAQIVGFPLSGIRIEEGLYEAHEKYVEEFVKSLPDDLQCVMIVGHNPTSTDFVNVFLSERIENLPTAGLVMLRFSMSSWSEISSSSLTSFYLDFPKNH